MPSEVEARLSELRTAADQMYKSSTRISESVGEVKQIIDTLLTLGFHSAGAAQFALVYGHYHDDMEEWAQMILLFSAKLREAAEEFEVAMNRQNADKLLNGNPLRYVVGGVRRTEADDSKPMPTYDVDDYVSVFNRPVYDRLVQERQALAESQQHLEQLLQARQEAIDDLAALKNRLVSFDKEVNLGTVPRVEALEAQIVGLDAEIANVQQSIGDLRTDIAELSHRLTLVKPGAGADLQLIFGLENTQTNEWIKQNTQDCVKYIVNKMPIPNGIPLDAHLWDDMAEKYSQYGITSGDMPLAGSVIVMETAHSYADDVHGHLMYVERVDGADVWVTDNQHSEPVKLTDITNELSGDNLKYLYFPWHTKV